MTLYSLGFAFNSDGTKLVVITKNRPKWQAGRWNGVGGHVEKGESPKQCVVREFEEETGVRIEEWQWKNLTVFGGVDARGEEFSVFAFSAFSDKIYDAVTKTDEPVSIVDVDLNEIRKNGISNLTWLIGLALDADQSRIIMHVTYQPPE